MTMTEENMVAAAISNLRVGFEKVLAGEIEVFKTKLVSPEDAEQVIQDLTGVGELEATDPNGWQWDHWSYFDYKGHRYCLSGCGFYGWLKLERDERRT